MVNEKITKTIEFFKQPKVINTIIIILFLAILISSTSIRLQNLPLLIDQTTGEYIPLALDPFYFLRVSETILDNGFLPEVDSMRYPLLNLPFTRELTPIATIIIYKAINIVTPVSIQFANVISPVIFFMLGLITFFFLTYSITKSKYVAILSMAFLAFISTYLYRTIAGFADHESIGMFAFLLTLLIYSLALNYLEKNNKHIIKTISYALILAILTIFTMMSWSGAFSYIIMIIPLSFLMIWIIRFKVVDYKSMFHYSIAYLLWVIFMIIIGYIIDLNVVPRFLSSYGLLTFFTFGFILCDYLLSYLISKNNLTNENIIKYRIFFSASIAISLGMFLFLLIGKSILAMVLMILSLFFKPFGTERIALTVAENVQPYLLDWMSKIGKILFWLSFSGMILIGFKLREIFSTIKGKRTFFISWIILISCIIFSRIYPGAILDGSNLFSKALYFAGILIFLFFGLKTYLHNDIKMDANLIFLGTLVLISIISLRSAARVFFLITPLTCIYASYFVIKIKDYIKNSKEIVKVILIILFVLSLIGSCIVIKDSYNQINAQAKVLSPSANYQWQGAMSWVRDNTNPGGVFIHWWDYGYWVQYLGQRPTIADGGHGNAYWDHLIGRYLLTNMNPSTAMSFMKSQEVSYLLIDQSDFGKYPAYSKIGGDENYDRFSVLSVGVIDNKQTQEAKNTITRVYPFNGIVDEDIIYKKGDAEIFLAGPTYNEIGEPSFNSFLGAMIITNTNNSFEQPIGIFLYNNQQMRLPIRYLYLQGNVIDFGIGIDGVVYLFPKVEQVSTGQVRVDSIGAITYLSPKVSKSLFAQLYLLNNAFNSYPTISLAHAEDDYIVNNLKMQGYDVGDIVHFNGFHGPIKIFKVDYSNDIKIHEEFTSLSGEYAELDYIK